MRVRVATSNPMKIEATKLAFATFFSDVRVVGVRVASSVSPQPVSFGEIVRGARSRARDAFGDCDYSVGIEAGIFRVAAVTRAPFQMTMAAVFDGAREALGAGPFYEVPERLVRDVVKADEGSVALVTRGKVTRGEVTRDAVLMALAPFLSPELYGPADRKHDKV
jgi:inosine/xanthosine triphosphatase